MKILAEDKSLTRKICQKQPEKSKEPDRKTKVTKSVRIELLKSLARLRDA